MKINIPALLTGGLVGITTCAGLVLTSVTTFADNGSVTDDVSITVPVACAMTSIIATGQEHTATLQPGTYSGASGSAYENGIGKTTLATHCNDYNGFSIYAIGFTGETEGDNTLVGTSASGGATIPTKVYESTDTTSNWSMKVTKITDTSTTFNPNNMTITNSFDSWHTVPDDYTKVAEYHASTGSSATDQSLGAKVETTYAFYISASQPADTYTGKVKYVMVHPYDQTTPSSDGIQVTYNGNGLTFPGGATSNQVTYRPDCTNAYYVSTTPEIVKTSNVADDGTKTTGYASDANELVPVTVTGADGAKVVVRYGLDSDTMLAVIEGNYDGQGEPEKYEMLQGQANGTATYTFNGDTVTFFLMNQSGSTPSSDYDYGFYAEVYGIYDTEPSTPATPENCPYTASTGTYIEPNHYKGSWLINDTEFNSEPDIAKYITDNHETLSETGLTINAYNPLAIMYDGNTNTGGTMDGFYTKLETTSDTPDLMAPNYYKTGYGFAGWSENPNAIVNGSDTIYGPNENIDASTLTYQDDGKTAMLYAVWVQSSGTMQGWSGCSTMTSGQVIALTDNRDNNTYTVGKMQDGNCWMMENLRLDNTATLSSSNTNNPASGFTSIAPSTDEWCTDDNNEACINQNKLNTNNTNLAGINSLGNSLVNAPGWYVGNNERADVMGDNGNNYSWYSYGNYYNFYTATAGTGQTTGSGSSSSSGSICPSGWFMPTPSLFPHESSEEEESRIASKENRSYPYNYVYSGMWVGSTSIDRGLAGYLWSNYYMNHDGNYYLHLDSEHSYISCLLIKGAAVRCLASSE